MRSKDFVILDFGSQYTWLVQRGLKGAGFRSEVYPFDLPLREIQALRPKGIILSGGPASVLDKRSPSRSLEELRQTAPLLAICYGFQLAVQQYGGALSRSKNRNYGKALAIWRSGSSAAIAPIGSGAKRRGGAAGALFPRKQSLVWMSHGDSLKKLPPRAEPLCYSGKRGGPVIGFAMERLLAFQFHPEVSHTERGLDILKAFAGRVCQAKRSLRPFSQSRLREIIAQIRASIPKGEKALCALSGGVDSTVTAMLLKEAIGLPRLRCFFVDTGLLRKGEFEQTHAMYKKIGLNVQGVRAADFFLSRLKGVSAPEKKRKIIGHAFIDIFKREGRGIRFLAQGTLYPDVIESLAPKGAPSAVIKSHHNVGGLPKDLKFKLIEPLRELFKDEVRALGRALKIPSGALSRHPFPGPGLAVRCAGAVTEKKLEIVREADFIFMRELKRWRLQDKAWQAFAVLLPGKAVGVQGDKRVYANAVALRAVTSRDGMTADWARLPLDFLHHAADRIIREVPAVSRVLFDITTKPPGTIEWE